MGSPFYIYQFIIIMFARNRFLLSVICGVVFLGCGSKASSDVILDVESIANKRAREVEHLLGVPDSTYMLKIMGKQIFCQYYKTHGVEIQYPNSLATDIIIHGPHSLPFNQTALKAFKLNHKKKHPSEYIKGNLMRWYDLEQFSAISFYNTEKDTLGNITNFQIFFKVKEMKK